MRDLSLVSLQYRNKRGIPVTELNTEEKVVSAKGVGVFNVANVIVAIALLLLVLGLLKWMGVSPI